MVIEGSKMTLDNGLLDQSKHIIVTERTTTTMSISDDNSDGATVNLLQRKASQHP
jgi:hypothetical protein